MSTTTSTLSFSDADRAGLAQHALQLAAEHGMRTTTALRSIVAAFAAATIPTVVTRTQLPQSTVYRLVARLEEAGAVVSVPFPHETHRHFALNDGRQVRAFRRCTGCAAIDEISTDLTAWTSDDTATVAVSGPCARSCSEARL